MEKRRSKDIKCEMAWKIFIYERLFFSLFSIIIKALPKEERILMVHTVSSFSFFKEYFFFPCGWGNLLKNTHASDLRNKRMGKKYLNMHSYIHNLMFHVCELFPFLLFFFSSKQATRINNFFFLFREIFLLTLLLHIWGFTRLKHEDITNTTRKMYIKI